MRRMFHPVRTWLFCCLVSQFQYSFNSLGKAYAENVHQYVKFIMLNEEKLNNALETTLGSDELNGMDTVYVARLGNKSLPEEDDDPIEDQQ